MKTFSNKIAIIGMIFYAMVFFACKEDETTIDRKDITVETITATPTQITLATGSTRAIKATVAPNGANQQIYWKSDNPEIATVANGIVTGISTGVVKITVKSVENSSLSGEVSVTVVAAAIPVESIAFDLESPNLTMYLDDELTVGVTFTPVDATNQQLIWQNSAPEVVSVTGEGVITALTRGRATITVKSAADVNITATLSILVTDPSVPVESISIPIDRTAMGVGQTKAITTAVLPDDATDKSLVWSSGSPSVATVSNGVITAVAPGVAVITVKSFANPEIENTLTVKVSDISALSSVFGSSVGLWLFEDAADLGTASVGQDLVAYKMAGNNTVGAPSDVDISQVAGPVAGSHAAHILKNSYYRCYHMIAANGGGAKVNEYTYMIDLKVPTVGSLYYSLLQTGLTNNTDGDIFIRPAKDWGFRGNYTSVTLINAGQWYRMVFSVKLGESAKYYLNGVSIDTRTSNLGTDVEVAAWPLEHILFFADNDGEDNVFDVGATAIWDRPLTAAEVTLLGGAGN